MKINAIVSMPYTVVDSFKIHELEEHFISYGVVLRSFGFCNKIATNKSPNVPEGTKLINLSLTGTKEELRKSVKSLYSSANQILNGVETQIAEYIPESIKSDLMVLENGNRYTEQYADYAQKYMKHCALHDQMPHPEVLEGYVF